ILREDGRVNLGTAFALDPHTLVTAAHNLTHQETNVWLTDDLKLPIVDYKLHPRYEDGVDIAVIHLPKALEIESPIQIRSIPLAHAEEVAGLGYANIARRDTSLMFVLGYVESPTTDYSRTVHLVSVSLNLAGGMSGGPVMDAAGKIVGVMSEVTASQE